jgi:predicted negative regulator of RcsB-dependent stress response
VIVGAGAPTTAVGELRARIAAAGGQASGLVLDVTDATGTARKVAGAVSLAPETWPPREASLPYNRALIDLQDSLEAAPPSVETTAATLNLAVVQMRLSSWEDALTTLASVKLPDGSGVSAGTVMYFTGLCHEALGHGSEAQAAFTKAAASTEARISQDGPLVAPLAQRKLQKR